MIKPKIGKIRKFDRYLGDWKITKILENQKIVLTLQLDKRKCKHCGEEVFPPRNYTFTYIEFLQESKRSLTVATSSCGRVVILQEFLSKEEIENLFRGEV